MKRLQYQEIRNLNFTGQEIVSFLNRDKEMTQKQIEEAAWSYGCAEMTDPATNGPLTKGFIAGVEWYRKALWRNSTDEQPQAGRRILTIEKDGIWMTTMSKLAVLVPGVPWCYVDDLMPKEEEK